MPEVDSGSGIALLLMGIIYAGGFLVGAWLLIRRLSRKEHQFHERDLPTTEDISEETEEE